MGECIRRECPGRFPLGLKFVGPGECRERRVLGNDSHKNGFAAHVKQQRVQTFFADAAGKGGGVGSIERFGQKPGIEQRINGVYSDKIGI